MGVFRPIRISRNIRRLLSVLRLYSRFYSHPVGPRFDPSHIQMARAQVDAQAKEQQINDGEQELDVELPLRKDTAWSERHVTWSDKWHVIRPVTRHATRDQSVIGQELPAHYSLEDELLLRPRLGLSKEPYPFHSQEWSMSNFPCSPTRNIASHSMENLAFHSVFRWKIITIPIINNLQGRENVLFELRNERVKPRP